MLMITHLLSNPGERVLDHQLPAVWSVISSALMMSTPAATREVRRPPRWDELPWAEPG
jgi:hypothetical protein